MRHREQAICLRTSDWSETSQVVVFLTRGCGVVRLIAKGAKRPKSATGGAIDLLAEGDLVYTDSRSGGLGTMIEFSESVARLSLRKDARRLNAALYAVELAGALLAEGDPLPEAFDLLHSALSRLAEADAPAPAVLAYYQWRLLRLAGLLGELRSCASCGAEVSARREVYFSSSAGGLLCDVCENAHAEKFRLDKAAPAGLAALQAVEAGKRALLPAPQADGVNRMLAYHATYQLGRPLKTARHAIGALARQRPAL